MSKDNLIDVRFKGELVGRIEPIDALANSILIDNLVNNTDVYEELRDTYSMIPVEAKQINNSGIKAALEEVGLSNVKIAEAGGRAGDSITIISFSIGGKKIHIEADFDTLKDYPFLDVYVDEKT